MSDESAEEKLMDAPTAEGADWLLQNLILAAKAGVEMPVTLTVTGVAISGFIVSGQRYLDLLNDQYSGLGTQDGKDFGQYMLEYKDALLLDDAEGAGPYYIHLRDAAYVSGAAQLPGARGMIWRGKVGDVSGFSLGAIKLN
ncbi:hypothetical protein EQ826_15295 [Ectopseudomonas mendocina]|nr:hypothetical protein [Pseudomonas mendocina]TRO20915.1 hypothetical protein EQ828_15350 [Pseudomonas mendocina]TRO24826.1 hypothetical protein EQ826_15295 [Pseudomonas mendocina]